VVDKTTVYAIDLIALILHTKLSICKVLSQVKLKKMTTNTEFIVTLLSKTI